MSVDVKGFAFGWTGSSGGTLASSQRVARKRGRPEPTSVQGKKGPGRAATLRSYTVKATRLADGRTAEETIGPAYWPKKRWQAERDAAFLRLVAKLKEGK